VSGTIQLDGEQWEVDGFGVRDKSWGPRTWQAPSGTAAKSAGAGAVEQGCFLNWFSMNFGADLALGGACGKTADGTFVGKGWIQRGDRTIGLDKVTMSTAYDPGNPLLHDTVRLDAVDAEGAAIVVDGTVTSICPTKIPRRDGITFVTVNRPDKLNALNDRTVEELDAAFAAVAADPAVRGVILTGAGEKAFVAGADIAELATQSPVDGKERSIRGQRVLDRIERLGKPVIAAVNGFALGGGCELAMACHVRVASESAKLGTPEVKLGIMCGYAGTQRLPRLVGKGRALEMLLTGEMVDAAEALRIGLVNRVVPREKLLAEAEGLMRKMLANGPVSLRFTLEAVNDGLETGFDEAERQEATLFGLICTTEDMKEGTKAFLDKRPARFQGK